MRRALKYAAAAVLLLSPAARADTEACARTLEHARQLHAEGRLQDAIRAMDACTACDAIADVCASTKAALVASVPTLMVSVHDCDGAPLADANLFVDGSPVAQGEPKELDPGPHAVRAELAGRTEEQTVIVLEHEKRRASLMLPGPARPIPPAAIVLGAASGVMLATAASLWAWGMSSSSATPTGPFFKTREMNASQPMHDDLVLAAAITLGAAVTTLVTAVVLYATRPFRTPKRLD